MGNPIFVVVGEEDNANTNNNNTKNKNDIGDLQNLLAEEKQLFFCTTDQPELG